MTKRSLRAERGKAAYFLVDLGTIPDEFRAEILEDAFDGGKQFGLKIVEEYLNGPARQPVYGVYYGDDEARWNEAKAEFGFEAAEADDSLRDAAAAQAAEDAEAQRAAEEAAVASIITPEPVAEEKPVNKARR